MKNITDLIYSCSRPLVIADNATIRKLTEAIGKDGRFIDIVYKTFDEVTHDILGKWSLEARINLSRDRGISAEYADILLKNCLLARPRINKKIDDLCDIREKYTKFLQRHLLAQNAYRNRTVIIADDYETDDLFNYCRGEISRVAPVISYISNTFRRKTINVYRFNGVKDEIFGLGYEVASLLEKGVVADNIKIHRFPDDYFPYFNEVFTLLGIDYIQKSTRSLAEYELVKAVTKSLGACLDLPAAEAFERVLAPYNNNDNPVLKSLIDVCNEYVGLEVPLWTIYADFHYTLSRRFPPLPAVRGAVRLTDVLKDYDEGDYIFIPACNQGAFPRTYTDDDYLDDTEKEALGLMGSAMRNEREKLRAKAFINKLPAVYISYATDVFARPTARSSLISEPALCHHISDIPYIKQNSPSYSEALDKIHLGKCLDSYYKYDIKQEPLFTLLQAYPEHGYRTYSNRFTGLTEDELGRHLRFPFILSYTSVDKYYKCPFLFYLEKVLGFSRNSNEDALYIGNLFHHILEKMVGEQTTPDALGVSLERWTHDFLRENNKTLSKKERYFLGKYYEAIKRFYAFLEDHNENTSFGVSGLEKPFKVSLGDDVFLCGKIDKILTYATAGKNYAVVVDYKSGGVDFDLNNVWYGLNMQLVIYFYFLNNAGSGPCSFGGAYLQGVLPNSVFRWDKGKTYREQWNNHFRLRGYSNTDTDILRHIDGNYDGVKTRLHGINVKKGGGFFVTSLGRLLSEQEFTALTDIAIKRVYEAKTAILTGVFPISPKRWSGGNDSCRYCPYGDICFREEADYENLAPCKNFSFLRGES